MHEECLKIMRGARTLLHLAIHGKNHESDKKRFSYFIENSLDPFLLEDRRKMDTRSWFAGICKECGFNVVVTQPKNIDTVPDNDYWWYCSNKECKNHEKGEETGDMQIPDWVGSK